MVELRLSIRFLPAAILLLPVFACGPDQRIGIRDAIAAYTINGAKLFGHRERLGSIEVGKKADLIAIDRNLIELADTGRANEIGKTRVVLTIFDGEVVYEATPSADRTLGMGNPTTFEIADLMAARSIQAW